MLPVDLPTFVFRDRERWREIERNKREIKRDQERSREIKRDQENVSV
jgi:hypothetical protein